jgi:phosphatidylserine decarboxylase
MQKFLSVLPQYLVPQHWYTRFFGWLAKRRASCVKNWMINTFIRRYQVDMSAAILEKPEDYPTFNSFFTRYLKPELRPIVQGSNQIACPVDGTVSQLGKIEKNLLLQAKGFYFDLMGLLGGNSETAKPFENGNFATLYLSPKDYHRIHMPLSGNLQETIYIPGKLFSVNQQTAEAVPRLFAKNERLVCLFDTEIGPMAVILVGAMIVGSMHTVWNDNPRTNIISRQTPTSIQLKRGDELGYFQLGSTVIVLFGENKMTWAPDLNAGTSVKMGQLLGTKMM